jgi:hypothetical protein
MQKFNIKLKTIRRRYLLVAQRTLTEKMFKMPELKHFKIKQIK